MWPRVWEWLRSPVLDRFPSNVTKQRLCYRLHITATWVDKNREVIMISVQFVTIKHLYKVKRKPSRLYRVVAIGSAHSVVCYAVCKAYKNRRGTRRAAVKCQNALGFPQKKKTYISNVCYGTNIVTPQNRFVLQNWWAQAQSLCAPWSQTWATFFSSHKNVTTYWSIRMFVA
jgi:hypothetical protein